MRKNINKVLAVMFVILLAFSCIGITGSADDKTGQCGSNATYRISDTTLTISGTGGVYNEFSQDTDTFKNVTDLVIEEGITNVGAFSFRGCTALRTVSFPAGFETIYSYAFENCENLREVYIRSLKEIYAGAFYKCTSLETIYYLGSSSSWNAVKYYDEKARLSTIDDSYNSNISDAVVIDSTVKMCGPAARYNISEGVLTISGGGRISENAFANRNDITKVVIENGITKIGTGAFAGCGSLEEITFSKEIKVIGYGAFSGCVALGDVYYYGSHSDWNLTVFQNMADKQVAAAESDNKPLLDATMHLTVSGKYGTNLSFVLDDTGLLTISGTGKMDSTGVTDPFKKIRSDIKKVVIKSGITSIEDSAFQKCSNLTEITIPDTVETIGNFAFSECTGLKYIHIPNSVELIRGNAFYKCTGLTEIVVPPKVLTIYSGTFSECTNLKRVKLLGQVTDINDYAFARCPNLTDFEIPDSVTSLGNHAFYKCTGLTEINIPDNTVSLGKNAFEDCTGLASVTIGKGIENVPLYAFGNCTGLKTVTFDWRTEQISASAFDNCNAIENVYYSGSHYQWSKMYVGPQNGNLLTTCIHCSDGLINEPVEDFYIINYTPTLSVEYRATVILNTNIAPPVGYKIVWSEGNVGKECMIDRITDKECSIQAKLVRIADNTTVKETQVETIKVNTGFFSRLSAFFRKLFGNNIVYKDNVKVK